MDQSPKNTLQTIKMIHFALLAGPLLFAGVAFWQVTSEPTLASQDLQILLYIPPFLFVTAFLISGALARKIVSNALKNGSDLRSKLGAFQTMHIVRMALFEAVSLFAGVVLFLTGSPYNLIIIGLVAVVFMSKVPSVLMLENEIGLTSEEKAQF